MKGAIANGYRTDLWTTQRSAEVVEKRFEVRFQRSHIPRLMHRINWSHHLNLYRRDKISVISGVSVSPGWRRLGLYYRLHSKKNVAHAETC